MQLSRLRRCLVFLFIVFVWLLCISTPWDWFSGFAGNIATLPYCVSAAILLVAVVLLSRIIGTADTRNEHVRRALFITLPEFTKVVAVTIWWSIHAAAGGVVPSGDFDNVRLYDVVLQTLLMVSIVLASHVVMRQAGVVGKNIGWKFTSLAIRHLWQSMAMLSGVSVACHIARCFIPRHTDADRIIMVVWFFGAVSSQILKFPIFFAAGLVFLSAFWSLRLQSQDWGGRELQRECQHFKAISGQQLIACGASIVVMLCQAAAIQLALSGAMVGSIMFSLCMALESLLSIILVNVLLGTFRSDTEQNRSARKMASVRKKQHKEFSRTYERCVDEKWQEIVEELAHQGFTVGRLLAFYKRVPQIMPHFDPKVHTTTDVVRSAIIPDSADEVCAYAQKMNGGVPIKPKRMVTHNWSNLFNDLVAAIVADALQQPTYDLIAHLLVADMPTLERALDHEALSMTYWVCAFSVNQHRSICGSNPHGSKDSKTGREHAFCTCGSQVYLNDTPPLRSSDSKGIMCQMNKFDDMIAFLSATDLKFSQVIAVDRKCGLFNRAWCVAELAAADSIGIKQNMKLASREAIESDIDHLKLLDVAKMQAARAEDVGEILEKIPDVGAFNVRLQELLFGEQGLFEVWSNFDVFEQAAELGRVALFARACRKRPPQVATSWRVEEI